MIFCNDFVLKSSNYVRLPYKIASEAVLHTDIDKAIVITKNKQAPKLKEVLKTLTPYEFNLLTSYRAGDEYNTEYKNTFLKYKNKINLYYNYYICHSYEYYFEESKTIYSKTIYNYACLIACIFQKIGIVSTDIITLIQQAYTNFGDNIAKFYFLTNLYSKLKLNFEPKTDKDTNKEKEANTKTPGEQVLKIIQDKFDNNGEKFIDSYNPKISCDEMKIIANHLFFFEQDSDNIPKDYIFEDLFKSLPGDYKDVLENFTKKYLDANHIYVQIAKKNNTQYNPYVVLPTILMLLLLMLVAMIKQFEN